MNVHSASVVIAVAIAIAEPRSAAAQVAAESPDAVARTMGDEGLRRFQQGKWQEAYELFQRANGAVPAPTLVLYMAHCQARRGDLIAARRLYREVAREPLAEDAPLQFRTAQGVAREELRWIEPRVSVLKISVTGVTRGRARIIVDGAEVPASELGEVAVGPGAHVVEVSIQGGTPARKTLTTVAGHAAEVTLAPRPPRSPTEALEPRAGPPAGPRKPNLLVPAGVTLGAGGLALLLGTVTGAISLHTATDVRSRCNPSGHCLATDAASAASANRLAGASTGMFLVGGVAVAAGITMVALHVWAGKPHPESGAAVEVNIGLGYGAVRGRF